MSPKLYFLSQNSITNTAQESLRRRLTGDRPAPALRGTVCGGRLEWVSSGLKTRVSYFFCSALVCYGCFYYNYRPSRTCLF